ncbi:hypothetical protein AB0O64_31590 [Streptomyces sp. NPDC088341]|uniref:hypothetical protein n=1 Tax=Streptomyces sp. NPDC088341 TaxID=3154870 RepID=UPI00341EDA64
MANESDPVVLRRVSYVILSLLFTIGFGVASCYGVFLGVSTEAGEPFGGASAGLGAIFLARRIWESKISLDRSRLVVVNPVRTYEIPYRQIASVEKDGSGGLVITTRQGLVVVSTGFAGSLIELFMKTTDRALERIFPYVKRNTGKSGAEKVVVRFTFSRIGDCCLALSLLCAVVAGILGA